MYFYQVLTRLGSYHGSNFLTYHSEQILTDGTVVSVSVRGSKILGIVMGTTPAPSFKTKNLTIIENQYILPNSAMKLLLWLISYYPAPLGSFAQLFLPASLEQPKNNPQPKESLEPNRSLPPFTPEQTEVLKKIRESDQKTFLVHGDTGTGKTRLYQELTAQVLAAKHSALIITPEIGLTTPLAKEFIASFGAKNVVVLHSGLTPVQRRNIWQTIAHGKAPMVVIGARSALFSPLKDIGLIVVDEFHETAYKQEQAPYYQGVRVAAQLARIHGATLILGSATPGVQDYYIAENKNVPILRMQTLATQKSLIAPKIAIIDLRDKNNASRNPHFSKQLLTAMETALGQREQILIFLNRRGTARQVLCQSCGWQAICPKCAIPLTYHGDTHHLQCHTCGYRSRTPGNCPVCQSPEILFKSAGTKAMATMLASLFPQAKIMRFDTDNKKAESLEQNYAAVLGGDVDILVGTQMVGKGLDLPRLGVVGIVAADSSLYFPDYTAEERTFQLLSQVIGRVGRGHVPGQAIIQSYTPDNPTLQYVVKKDWDSFYHRQLDQRKLFLFPPFCHLLKLTCTRATAASAQKASTILALKLKKQLLRVEVNGPSPSFIEKTGGKHRWQLVIKTKNRAELLKIIPLLPSGWTYDLDPNNLL